MPKDELDPEDPMQFVGMGFPGTAESDELMARAVVEEFLLFGRGRDDLMELFINPFYRATHRIYLERGETFVRDQIDRVMEEWGPKTEY